MGLFRKSKKQEKTDTKNDDPIWSELRKYRENRKRKAVSGTGTSEKETPGEPSFRDGAPENVRSSLADLSQRRLDPSNEYQCKECNLKFKESWNRCPKCGGEITLMGLDKSEDVKKLYPEHRTGPMKIDTPVKPSPAGPTSVTGKPVKTVKKVRRVPTPTQGRTPPIRTNGREKKVQSSEGSRAISARRSQGRMRDQQELDALFTNDPLLDNNNIVVNEQKPVPRSSWKNVAPLVEPTPTQTHTPPPEVKSMLDDLMKTEVDTVGPGRPEDCPECGFTNPPGSWDFCMKCGFHY